MRLIIGVVLINLMTATASAEVIKSAVNGFIIQHSTTIAYDHAGVFKTMTGKVGDWWSPEHSFSGDASNMSVDSHCFCERWDGNLVRHLNTTIWIENAKVVMEGGLGPLKELGLNGTMIWLVAPIEDGGTSVTWKYHVHGFSETVLVGLAPVVDGVLKEQIGRLAGHLK